MSEKNQLSEDYISLSGFEKGLRHFLRNFFWLLSYLRIVLVKSIHYVLIGLIAGLILGYLYYITRPVYYKVSMVVEFNELTKKTYAEMIEQLSKLTGSGAGQRLGKALQISDHAAANIAVIDAKDMNDNPLSQDTSTRRGQMFKIVLKLTDNTISDSVERGIVNYLNESPFLKKLKLEQKKIFIEKLAFVNSDIQKMDSLKIEFNHFLSRPNSATFYNNAFNPAELYAESSKLADEKEKLMHWLAISNVGVSIVDGFKVSTSPQSLSLFNSMLILGILGFLIGYLLGFMKQTKKLVNSF